jgi:hypothetical protein
MLGTDEILKKSGRGAFFGHLLGSAVNIFLPETAVQKREKK